MNSTTQPEIKIGSRWRNTKTNLVWTIVTPIFSDEVYLYRDPRPDGIGVRTRCILRKALLEHYTPEP